MFSVSMRRLGASVLLAMLLAGPLGPLGAQHVAHLVPLAASSDSASVGAAPLSTGHDGRTCAICHLLSGLRWMLVAQVAAVPPEAVAIGLAPAGLADSPLWLGDAPSSRAPPRS